MIEKIVDLSSSLRIAGISVSISETLEAAAVMKAFQEPTVRDKEKIRLLLQACLLKKEEQSEIFHEQFERWWVRWFGERPSNVAFPEILDTLRKSIVNGDVQQMEETLNAAVANAQAWLAEEGGLPGQGQGGAAGEGNLGAPENPRNPLLRAGRRRAMYHHLRALLRFEALAQEMDNDSNMSMWQRQHARQSLNKAEALLRKTVFHSGYATGEQNASVRSRLKDADEDVSELPISKAAYTQIQKMQKLVPDIVRQLSYQKKYKDHHQKGILHMRKTMRKSLANGGFPIEITFKRKLPKRERIAILCDLSGSVEIFSQFALQLASCFSSQFAGIACYGFISDIDEITRYVSREDFPRSMSELYSECNLVLGTSSSDYGQVFQQFVKKYLHDLAKSSSVIILGDARNNGRDPGLDAFKTIKNWVKKVYWLNPEPASSWTYGDSVMKEYAEFCDAVHPIQSVKDLAKFVASLRGE